MSNSDAETEFYLIVSIWTERGTSAQNEPDVTTEYLFRGREDVFVEERRFVTPLRPLQLIFVREIEDGLSERAGLLHFFVDSFRDAIKNKLKPTIIGTKVISQDYYYRVFIDNDKMFQINI